RAAAAATAGQARAVRKRAFEAFLRVVTGSLNGRIMLATRPATLPAETVTLVFPARYQLPNSATGRVRYAIYSRLHERRHLHQIRQRSHCRVRFDRCLERHGLRPGRA